MALSAFHSFFRGMQAGRFPQLADRDNLWGVLITLTTRKAADLVQHQRRLKRGGGAVQGESAFLQRRQTGAEGTGIEQVADPKPTLRTGDQLAAELEELLDKLGNASLQEVALAKLEGYTNEEIAARHGCSPRTIDRKLRSIRIIWKQHAGDA